MNYLSGALRYVAGADDEPQNLVPRLVDRIKTSALPHDRRSAIIQLADAAKESPQHQAQVGELSLKILHAILDQDADYDETILSTLELLIILCGTLDAPNSAQRDQFLSDTRRIASTNTDVFLGLPNALSLLLQTLDKHDFHIKFNTIELLAAMAANSRQILQAAVLETPQGVSRICDLLEDSHRQIRSNSIPLLSSLCDDSSEICKIAVFSGAFGKLFALTDPIVSPQSPQPPRLLSDSASISDDDDGTSVEDAILLQDVLSTVGTLINGTPSTQSFFRDAGCVQRLISILQRLVGDASLIRPSLKGDHSVPTAKIQTVSETQARKTLCTAFACLTGLVSGSGEESLLVRNDFANATVLKILVSIAFASSTNDHHSNQPPSASLQLQISGFKVISCLVRGHDGFRSLFNSSTFTVTPNSVPVTPQVSLLGIMMGEISTAARLAAFSILKDSFVADPSRNIPSTALITAMTNTGVSKKHSLEGNKNLSHGSLPSAPGFSDASDALAYVCDSLKCAIIGWPADAVPADVFYASRFFCWMLHHGESARERLLGTHVSGGSLLSQTIRALGKCERDSGPPEVRVSLFTVVCVWLYQSPQAVSTFLSSAMNLPMVLDVIKRNQSNTNESYVLIRGLAAVLLGICLWVADTSSVAHSDGRFVSGDGVTSNVIPRELIEDVIRSRVGVTEFTACLDEFRATTFFSADMSEENIWKFIERKAAQEELDGYGSVSGNVGHQYWLHQAIISVANDVYSYVCTRALDLMDGPSFPTLDHTRDVAVANGHDATGQQVVGPEDQIIADSARDEVLQSYKEFIRSQDESLNAARLEIEELSTALRKAQSELDSKAHVFVDPRTTDAFLFLQSECNDLRSQKEDLEALLQEKTSDFEAVSNTLAALEDEQTKPSDSLPVEGSTHVNDQLHKLYTDNEVLRQSLESEMQKNIELSHKLAALNDSLNRKDTEISTLMKERDAMRESIQPDVSEALSWRSRAEVAEASLHSKNIAFQSLQEKYLTMHDHATVLERSRDEAIAKVHTMKDSLDEKGEELELMKQDRDRGLASSSVVDKEEVEEMRNKLEDAMKRLQEKERDRELWTSEASELSFNIEHEHDTMAKNIDTLKSELLEAKMISSQWEQRAESLSVQCTTKDQEILKYQAMTHQLDEKLSVAVQTANSHKNRATELEQQCVELDELRQKIEDEVVTLRKELELRTEQSIRLSGQVYEMEETKVKLDAELQKLHQELEKSAKSSESKTPNESLSAGDGVVDASENELHGSLREKLASVELELESAKEALADSRDKESMLHDLAQDRDSAVAKAMSLEETLHLLKAENRQLSIEINNLKESVLSLEEAEDAKRVLTMQVFELQKALEDKEPPETEPGGHQPIPTGADRSTKVDELQQLLDVRDSRILEIENSLIKHRNDEDVWIMEKDFYEKQISEKCSELNSLRSERDQLQDYISEMKADLEVAKEHARDSSKLEALEFEVEEKTGECDNFKRQVVKLTDVLATKDEEIRLLRANGETALEDLKKRLSDAEGTSRDLADRLEASESVCQQVKRELYTLQNLNQNLDEALHTAQNGLKTVQAHSANDMMKANVENVVSTIIASVAIETTLLSSSHALERALLANIALEEISNALSTEQHAMKHIKEERDEALSTRAALNNRIDELNKELTLQKGASSDNQADSVQSTEISVLSRITDANVLNCSPKTNNDLTNTISIPPRQISRGRAGSSFDGDTKMQKRIVELEDALRDAARTVSATNTELLAAQALLVELSSDKTIMRSTLSNAEQRIVELEQQISTNCGLEVDTASERAGTLSDVSDVEGGEANIPLSQSGDAYKAILLEEQLKAAQLEGDSLRLIFKRSVHGVDIADTLLSTVLSKMDEVESSFYSCRAEVTKLKRSEQNLLLEIEQLNLDLAKSKTEVDDMFTSFQKEKLDLVKSHVIEMEELALSKSTEIESFKEKIGVHEKDIAQLQDDLRKLLEKFTQASVNWGIEKERMVVQHNDKLRQQEMETTRLSEKLDLANKNWESERTKMIAQHRDELRGHENETVRRESLWISEKDELVKEFTVCQAEKIKVERQLEEEKGGWEVEKTELVKNFETKLEQHSRSAATTVSALKKQLEDCDTRCNSLTTEKGRLNEELGNVSSRMHETKERCEKLELMQNEMVKQTTEMKGKIDSLFEEKSSYEVLVQRLNKVIEDKEATLMRQKLEHESIMRDEKNKWWNEVKEYEEEIDRSLQGLETLERKLRDSEAASNLELEKARVKQNQIEKKLQMESIALQECKRKLEESRVCEIDIQKELARQTALFSNDRKKLTLELESSNDELCRLVALQNELNKKLQVTEDQVTILRQNQSEELERRTILEDENQEFIRNVEVLEQRCKRVDNALKEKTEAYEQLRSRQSALEIQLQAESDRSKILEQRATGIEDQLQSSSATNQRLREDLDSTRRKLEETEAQCLSWSRDNEDLREWVEELQKKAVDLQAVANDFEEVEQSLRETINAHQQSEEQIGSLEDDLRAIREELRQRELRTRRAEREKAAMEELIKSHEHKSRELEQRLADIRETSVAKLSASEAGVRAQARRCAELETALAQAERQIAEFGASSDEAFAAKAEVRQLKEESTRLREKCRDAETLTEQLESELQKVKDETEALRRDSGEGQLRALEAEHNELLVYLADLELELTSLREGTEQES